jgi:RNA polymerase sigma-70 factor, ECF subfamily
MEPSTRSYNPNRPRVPRMRGAGASKRRESPTTTPATPAMPATATDPAAAAAEAKPRGRRRAATPRGASSEPRSETSAAAGYAQAEPERASQASSAAVATEPPPDASALAAQAAVDEATTASAPGVSEPGPLIGVQDFEDIFTRFQTPITNFIYRLVGNREQAFDLAQDVFVKAYRALSGGATIQAGALSSWLYRIASNTATDALRRRRLISWLPLSLFNDDRGVGAGMPGVDNGFGQQGLSEEHLASAMGAFTSGYDGGRFEQRVADREIVERVLKRLPEKYAACLLLYEHEGFSCAEIADVLHVTPSAVKMRLMRARERFISIYQQEMEGRQ